MRDSYYDEELKRLNEKKDLAVVGMRFALKYVKFKEKNQERAKKAVAAIIDKILQAEKYTDKRKKVALLNKKLADQEKVYGLSLFQIEKELSEYARRCHIAWTNKDSYSYTTGKIESMAGEIAKDPTAALLKYASDYTTAIYNIEQTRERRQAEAQREREEEARRKEEEAKKRRMEAEKQKAAQQLAEQRRREYSTRTNEPTYGSSNYGTSSYTPSYTSSSYGTSSYDRTTPTHVSEEYIQRKVQEELAKGTRSLNYTLINQIQESYKRLDGITYYGGLYSSSGLEDVYSYYVMTGEEKVSPVSYYAVREIMEMGTLAVSVVFKDLMTAYAYNTTHMARFMEQFEPHKALERYQKAYDRYMNYYNRLNAKERSQVDTAAAKNERYFEFFHLYGKTGRDIATVDDIKRVVNAQIKEKYVDTPIISDNFDNYNDFKPSFPANFRYSLQYMSVTEIASLYKAVMYKRDNYYISGDLSEEERARIYKIREEKGAKIQELFADAIRNRLTNIRVPGDLKDEQAKAEYLNKRERDLIAICRDYFHEEPKFAVSQKNLTSVKEGYGEQRVETAEALAAAERRYFGMNKLEQVLAGMNFRRLREYGKKDTLTPEEMARVKKMF